MSFVSYDRYTQKALSGPGMTMDKLFNVGDIVEARIVEKHIADMPPLHCDANLVQFGEQYSFSRNDKGKVQPCYITFAFENNDWVFKGACFEKSLVNRCNLFDYANPSVGKYCLDKFYSEYVRAADKLLADEARGVNVDNRSVIDDYMKFDVFTMAGYYLDAHAEMALNAFKDNWKDYQADSLYKPVVALIEQQDKPLSSMALDSRERESRQGLNDINDLISNATLRSFEANGAVGDKEVKEMDI